MEDEIEQGAAWLPTMKSGRSRGFSASLTSKLSYFQTGGKVFSAGVNYFAPLGQFLVVSWGPLNKLPQLNRKNRFKRKVFSCIVLVIFAFALFLAWMVDL